MRLGLFFKKVLSLLGILFIGLNPAFAETVSSSLSDSIAASATTSAEVAQILTRELISEPIIRVGLYKTKEDVKFISEFSYEVWSGDRSRGTIPAGELATLSYKNGIYTFKSASISVIPTTKEGSLSQLSDGQRSLVGASLTRDDKLEFGSSDYLRLVPEDQHNFFTLVNYNRPVKGRKKINFNAYRGTLEYRYSPKSKQTFVINELPLDSYVAGVAETYDSAPKEYIKALMVAARSYAYAHISKTPPTEKRMFDVYPTTVDQIYLGYNSELFMPNVAQAAAETAGEMVTYHGAPVATPYFSHSNGYTSNWKGKDRPWLKSVPAVYDKGKKMFGHGMGMSNSDAEKRARKDGWTYDQILKYYYTSTTVEKVY